MAAQERDPRAAVSGFTWGFCTACRGKAPVVVVGILWVSVGADEVLDVLTPHHDAGYLIWEWADPTGLTRE
jgi:hypothetical protein